MCSVIKYFYGGCALFTGYAKCRLAFSGKANPEQGKRVGTKQSLPTFFAKQTKKFCSAAKGHEHRASCVSMLKYTIICIANALPP